MTKEDEKKFHITFIATFLGVIFALGFGLLATGIGEPVDSTKGTKIITGLILVVGAWYFYNKFAEKIRKEK